jgi:uncharacterized protein
MSAPGPNPPPGWYPDDQGLQRWWTGDMWGAYAPAAPPMPYPTSNQYPASGQYAAPPPPSGWYAGPPPYPGAGAGARSDATTLAMLAHLGMLVGGFIVPLVIYLTSGKDDPFVRHHSSEALNFAITYAIASFALMPLFFIGVFLLPLLLLLIPAFFALIISQYVWLIMASMKSYRGEWWRYPICIRLVSGLNGAGAMPR